LKASTNRLLTVLASLVVALLIAEIFLRFKIERELSESQVIVRAPGAGLGPLLTDRAYPYRLERLRRDGAELVLTNVDRERRYAIRRGERRGARVIALGDSLTEIWNVPGFENWVTLLEAELHAEAIPIGVGGYNTAHEVGLFIDEFSDLDSDVLVLEMSANDGQVLRVRPRGSQDFVVPNVRCKTPVEIRLGRLPETPAEGRWPDVDVVAFDCRERTFDRLLGSRLLWTIDRFLFAKKGDETYGTRLVAADSSQRDALRKLRDWSDSRRIPVLIVVFPLLSNKRTQVEARYFDAVAAESGFPVLDLTAGLSSRGSLESFRNTPSDPIHPNVLGHHVAAELVAERLRREKMLPER
jgi:lysophospholipase L1-like esterase